MIDIPDLSDNLERKEGIWYSKTKIDVSYPDNGNDLCFQIEDDSYWFKHRNNCIIELVKNFPPQAEIIDIGGGNGFVSKGLEENGFATVILEPGIIGVNNSKKRNLNTVICSSLENSGFKSDSVSAIGCFDVIEHIENDYEFVSTLKSLLIKGGMLYLTVPSNKILWSNEDKIAGHYRRYSKHNIETLLTNTGFKIVYCSYLFSILIIPVLLFRTIPSWFGIKKTEIKSKELQNQHRNDFLGKILDQVWYLELKLIKRKRKIFQGTSLIICAVKDSDN